MPMFSSFFFFFFGAGHVASFPFFFFFFFFLGMKINGEIQVFFLQAHQKVFSQK